MNARMTVSFLCFLLMVIPVSAQTQGEEFVARPEKVENPPKIDGLLDACRRFLQRPAILVKYLKFRHSRYKDHGNVFAHVVFHHIPVELNPSLVGHFDVQQDQIRFFGKDGLHPVPAIRRRAGIVALILKPCS